MTQVAFMKIKAFPHKRKQKMFVVNSFYKNYQRKHFKMKAEKCVWTAI